MSLHKMFSRLEQLRTRHFSKWDDRSWKLWHEGAVVFISSIVSFHRGTLVVLRQHEQNAPDHRGTSDPANPHLSRIVHGPFRSSTTPKLLQPPERSTGVIERDTRGGAQMMDLCRKHMKDGAATSSKSSTRLFIFTSPVVFILLFSPERGGRGTSWGQPSALVLIRLLNYPRFILYNKSLFYTGSPQTAQILQLFETPNEILMKLMLIFFCLMVNTSFYTFYVLICYFWAQTGDSTERRKHLLKEHKKTNSRNLTAL